ncbi:MAG: hypothetical protein Q9183_003305, partial [Haloplaca sp. 2 TL-2023]
LSHPAVILEHSHYIKSVQCFGSNLEIVFTSKEAHDFARQAWAKEKDFILSTYTSGCGSPKEQHTFWLVDHFKSGYCETCVTAVVKHEIATEDALHEVDLVWGQYMPDPSPKASRPNLQQRQEPNAPVANEDCGAPPSPEIDGFPTAACNSPTFDEDLDDTIGYLDFGEGDYSQSLERFMPGLGDYSAEANEGFGPTNNTSAGLVRRQARPGLRERLAAVARRTLGGAGAKLASLGTFVVNAVSTVGTKIVNGIAISPRVSLTIPLTAPLPRQVDSPWGEALEVFRKGYDRDTFRGGRGAGTLEGNRAANLAVYCVRCGIRGQVQLNGQARWALKGGLRNAVVGISGNVAAGLSIGIDADIQVKEVFDFPIVAIGVPGWQIYGVIIVGPSLGLKAVAELNIALAGQVLAGVDMEIGTFNATIDFVDGSKSRSLELNPRYIPVFNATGQITAAFAFGLPLSIGVGLEIPGIKYKKTASINDVPSFQASLNYTASTTDVGVGGNTDCVNGIGYNVEFVNDVYADLFGLAKYELHQFKRPLTGGCKLLGAQPAGASTKRALIAGPKAKPASRLTRRQEDGPEPFDYVTSLISNSTANDTLFQAVQNASLAVLAEEERQPNNTELGYPSDTNFTTIRDLSNVDELFAEANGNIYYAPLDNGTIFASVSGIVEGDGANRFFHYYPDVMEAYNVSRLRLSEEEFIPITSDFIALAPVNYDDNSTSPDIYVAVDTIGGVFFPVTCDIRDQPSKAFIVADIETGVEKLRDPNLRYTVTGGIVERCYFLPWAAPSGSGDAVAAPTESPGAGTSSSASGAASAP